MSMDHVQARQHEEYRFPYHYLAQLDGRDFKSHRNWGWSISYVTALKLVTGTLDRLGTRTHIDIGCGDGALVHHLARNTRLRDLSGIDFDKQAIVFARSFNPEAKFIIGDIRRHRWPSAFDSATLIEVLEHIPSAEVADFLAATRDLLSPSGRLIMTVPHANKPIKPKHYRHYTFETLREAVGAHFEVEEMFGFERRSWMRRAVRNVLANRRWFVEIAALNRVLLASELRYRTTSQRGCGRIFAVLRPRPA